MSLFSEEKQWLWVKVRSSKFMNCRIIVVAGNTVSGEEVRVGWSFMQLVLEKQCGTIQSTRRPSSKIS